MRSAFARLAVYTAFTGERPTRRDPDETLFSLGAVRFAMVISPGPKQKHNSRKITMYKPILIASLLASLVAGPTAFADPPDKERKEAYKEQMKEERERMKRRSERERENRKERQETEREARKDRQEMERERRKHREEMQREQRKHREEMQREDRKYHEEMERERRKQREEMERERRKNER